MNTNDAYYLGLQDGYRGEGAEFFHERELFRAYLAGFHIGREWMWAARLSLLVKTARQSLPHMGAL